MSSDASAGARRPDVSIVTVVYRTGPALRAHLASVLAQTADVELLVVDNGEDEADRAALAAHAGDPRLHVISGHGNIGFAAGCNLGAADARGSLLWFVNPDAAPPPHAAARLAEILNVQNSLAAVGSTLVDASGTVDPACRRAPVTPLRAILQGLGLHDTILGRRLLKADPEESRTKPGCNPIVEPVGAVSGACIMMRAHDFAELGGFDARYFLHVEDVDLCHRIRAAGGVVLSVHDVRTRHARSTSAASVASVERAKAAGFDRYFRTHFSWWNPLALVARLGGWARFAVRAMRAR